MLEIRVTSSARSDLSHIWLYLAEESLAAADRLMIGFQQRFERLARNSELGERRKIGEIGECRCFLMKRYAIY
ncbi:type II toxin-antitoxin system RelE/ParE family toxin [Blastopirellula marina]|uniref:Plasmid stabilization system n=1 Tax=Blastopirellula marina DSM 3645 TaxID=314230 RepID=A3ZLK4_9BACT|nr:hypothetical protein DSM3645_09567 [Blastopirellula marina DSM 3645]